MQGKINIHRFETYGRYRRSKWNDRSASTTECGFNLTEAGSITRRWCKDAEYCSGTRFSCRALGGSGNSSDGDI